MTRHFLGVDIGTYSSKGVIVDELGRVIASHTVAHDLQMPRPGYFEHDAEGVWWGDFVAITRRVLADAGIDASAIAAVGVSAISPAIVPVDSAGNALRPGILYGIDTRATLEIAEIEGSLGGGEAFYERYGASLSSQSASPKVRWIRRYEPEVWARTRLILSAEGFVVWKLTGEAVIDVYDVGAYAPLFDTRAGVWDPAFDDLVAPVEKQARVTWACEIAGHVTPRAAEESGLAVGTPVITGTADAAAEAISAGLGAVGDMMIMYGSSIFFIVRTDHAPASRRFWGGPFLEEGTFSLAGGMSTAGSLTRWFRDTLGQVEVEEEARGGPNAYAALAALAASSPPGANGLIALPYFAGERTPLHDPAARGLWLGLTLTTTRADLYRAVLEAVGFGIRHNVEVMGEEGVAATRVLAVGGGTANLPWMQMVSDITGIQQHIPAQQIGASFGDAMMAAVGIGFFASTAEASAWVRPGRVIVPNPANRTRYDDYYAIYRALYAQTLEAQHALSRLARASGT